MNPSRKSSDAAQPSGLRRTLNGLTRATNGVAIAANVTGTLVVLGLVLVVNYDIVARGLFNRPFHGAVELVQFAMVLIVFLQLPDVIRVERLTRSDGLLIVIGARHPRVASAMRRLIDGLSFVLMALIAITIFPEFLKMWDTQDYFGIPGVFTAPWWPIKLTILFGTALCAAIFALKSIGPSRNINASTPEQS
ncbi:TRAP-type C4-dicarboxylate transport system, small permease component [Thalassovita gelatinovora]|uniref:TRAP transporter small permease protein n=1 Tax=Thalassovita gelatinovora TaxID=53501 RepID=A0A0N7LVC2_THAGE|nr:TRAP transporter small permease [Thalassovita gelatinovora]QIZ78968.1 TRAP transporter small permease [Thalassovita gelatinovora]CUH65890.1 TRAP-type C4-dicarboxylate transport system, small permease component [Thalassovita gelatinovora]SEQ73260.1 TRAP-type mannitol/chloroaromatic compound transport system, small permease component [Thalassovita gelatinovora]